MAKKHKSLSWKPKLDGDVYCAPACGRGCTVREYIAAERDAKKLASQVKGFIPRVHENLGWHFSAEALDGHITVRKHHGGKYGALASITNAYAGNIDWGDAEATTAQKAVDKIKANLRAEIRKLTEFLQQIEAVNGE